MSIQRGLRWMSVLGFVASACGDDPRELGSGGAASLRFAEDGKSAVLMYAGKELLDVRPLDFSIGIVRTVDEDVAYDPYWLEANDPALGSFVPPDLIWQKATAATLRENEDIIDVTFEGGSTAALSFRSVDGRITLELEPKSVAPVVFVRAGVRVRAGKEERFYGLGEHLDQVEQRGTRRAMQMEPTLGVESANNEAHVPVPLLMGSSGFGLFVESDRLGVFEVATEGDDWVEFTYATQRTSCAADDARPECAPGRTDPLKWHLFAKPRPLEVLKDYYGVTGFPLLPAEWAYGPLIWRDENDDQAQVLDDIKKIRDLDLATSGIWIDRPYASAVNTFDFDPERFPDPAAMVRAAHDAGLRVSLWHTPYIESSAAELLAEAKTKGYFPPKVGLALNTWGDPLDFTNPEAYAWWQGMIRRYSALGIEGYKLDYAEDVLPSVGGGATHWKFHDGRDERTMHHHYPILYHRIYAETLPETGGFLLGRAGRFGDQTRTSVIWPGDLDADFTHHMERVTEEYGSRVAVGGLPASIIMGLSLSTSGFPFFGADTGGYRHSPPDEETFIRWFEQTALSSVMQVGDSSSQPPWEFNEENGRSQRTLDWYREYARLHLRLFPYAWSYARAIATTGEPITRPFGFQRPTDGRHPSDTYFFGDDLLVAPVIERGARERSVPFPEGQWTDWWTGETFDGPADRVVPAPLEKLPLYLRSGAFIPLLSPEMDTLAVATSTAVHSHAVHPGRLWLRGSRGVGEHTFSLFDGTRYEVQASEKALRVTVSSGSRFTEGFVIEVFGTGPAKVARVDGTAATPLHRTEPTGTLTLEVPSGSHTVEIEWVD